MVIVGVDFGWDLTSSKAESSLGSEVGVVEASFDD
jgi:hypothetical protein